MSTWIPEDGWPTWCQFTGYRNTFQAGGWRPKRRGRDAMHDNVQADDRRWNATGIFTSPGLGLPQCVSDGCRRIPPRQVPWCDQ